MTLVEFALLWLYIYPLYKLDLGRGRRSYQVVAHKNFQKDLGGHLMTPEQSYHGISVESTKSQALSSCNVELSPASELLKNYHLSVRRNFWSGILGAFVAIQYMAVFFAVWTDIMKLGVEYVTTGILLVHTTFTFFAIYICLVFSYPTWRQALIPTWRQALIPCHCEFLKMVSKKEDYVIN